MLKPVPVLQRLPVYYGWIVIAVAFVTMAIAVNARTSFSLLFPEILDEFGWQRGVTAATFSIGFIASGLFSPVIGALMDRWGPRFVIPMGAVMVIGGLYTTTLVSSPIGLYLTLGVFVITGSIAMSYMSHSMFLYHWFVRRRGMAVGLAFSGVGIGSITLLPWFQRIIDTGGWRQACLIISLTVAIIIPLNILLQRKRPEDLGLLPDGEKQAASGEQKPSLDLVVDRAWAETDWTLGLAVRTGRFWWIFWGYFFGLFAWYSVLVHQTIYLVETGFDSQLAATALGFVGLLAVAGQIGVGAFSDRVGREWGWTAALTGFVICYAGLILLAQGPSLPLLALVVGGQGLLGQGLSSLYGAFSAEVFSGRRFATIFAWAGLGGNVGAGVGPWVTGYIFDVTGSYLWAFWLCLGVSLVSIFCMWMASPGKVRRVAGRAARAPKSADSG